MQKEKTIRKFNQLNFIKNKIFSLKDTVKNKKANHRLENNIKKTYI